MTDSNPGALAALFAAQLGVVLLAAKLGGEVAERWLRQPAVLGELAAGVAIGPFALGGLDLPLLGRSLFSAADGQAGIPISTELYVLAQVAAVFLLFFVGLETDLQQFLRFGMNAAAVAAGGVALPFVLGAVATAVAGYAPVWTHPTALFMGAVMTATSVGITARVLADIGKLDTAEGVTILGAAVIDDILGILILAVAVGAAGTGSVSLGEVGLAGARALGFWLALTALAVFLAGRISDALLWFRTDGAAVALALALTLLASFLSERFGLALIIGAYSIGLALSTTPLARSIADPLRGVYHTFVPVFFVVMGMLVDLSAVTGVLWFGLVISAFAIVGKLVGAYLPAFAVGFNAQGATRIGIGMLPRGEVALIVASVGLASGVIGRELFGVAILMTVVTTMLAPVLLVPAFQRGGEGRTAVWLPGTAADAEHSGRQVLSLEPEAAGLLMRYVERTLVERGFANLAQLTDPTGRLISQYEKDDAYLSVTLDPPVGSRQELVIEFEGAPWRELVSNIVDEAAQHVINGILSATTSIDQPDRRDGGR